jgi:peroxiredoxin Q/BCP
MKIVTIWCQAMILMVVSMALQAADWTGKAFPQFKLSNQYGEVVTNGTLQDHWVVYYFYPKDDTPGCSIEAENFAKNYEALKAMGLEVVGISLDDVESHKAFADKFGVKFHLLADVDKALSEQLDLVNTFPWPHTRRESFIVNPEGVIAKHYPEVSPKKHVAEIMDDFKHLAQAAKAK